MQKRGLQLAFGFIFSIILIAAILFVSFYAISKFSGVKKCTEDALFYESFQERIDSAWRSEIVKDVFSERVSSGIKEVCIGELSNLEEKYRILEDYSFSEGNVFMWPPEKACEDFASHNIEHIGFEHTGIKCFTVVNGRVEIPIEKGSTDALVMIRR